MLTILRPLLPHIAALAAVVAVIMWLDHRGYRRARTEMAAASVRAEARIRTDLRQSEQRTAERLAEVERAAVDRIAGLDQIHRTVIQPTVIRELSHETRYSDPASGISDGLRAEVNRALAAVACSPAADGGIVCTLSDARSARDE